MISDNCIRRAEDVSSQHRFVCIFSFLDLPSLKAGSSIPCGSPLLYLLNQAVRDARCSRGVHYWLPEGLTNETPHQLEISYVSQSGASPEYRREPDFHLTETQSTPDRVGSPPAFCQASSHLCVSGSRDPWGKSPNFR